MLIFLVYSFPAHLLFSSLKNSLDGRLRKHNDHKKKKKNDNNDCYSFDLYL